MRKRIKKTNERERRAKAKDALKVRGNEITNLWKFTGCAPRVPFQGRMITE